MTSKLTILIAVAIACTPPELRLVIRERAEDPGLFTALCAPDPSEAPFVGRLDLDGRNEWSIDCGGDLVLVCALGVSCVDSVTCSCVCEHDGDCEEPLVRIDLYSPGAVDSLTPSCRAGVCDWSGVE